MPNRPRLQQSAFFQGKRAFDAFLAWNLGALQLIWAAYMILMPRETLMRSPAWVGALAIVPGHDLRWLGAVMLFSGSCLLLSRIVRDLFLVALPGHVIGCATWAMIGGSFAYAAWLAAGLGAANAAVSVFFAAMHAAFIWQRRL